MSQVKNNRKQTEYLKFDILLNIVVIQPPGPDKKKLNYSLL